MEDRTGGADHDFLAVLTFDSPINGPVVTVTSGSGTVTGTSISGTELLVNLNGAQMRRRSRSSWTLPSQIAALSSLSVPALRFLLRDTTENAAVDSSDIGQAEAQSGQPVIASSFRQDVPANGSINSSDISLVKFASGTAVP